MTDKNSSDAKEKLSANVGRLLNDLAKDFELRTLKKCHARGYKEIRSSHCSFLANLGFEQTRLTDLALRASITQQAMGKLVRELEEFGYIQREIDSSDKRAKLISLTSRGEALLHDTLEIIDEVVAEYTEKLGADSVCSLTQTLRLCIAKLAIPTFIASDSYAMEEVD